MTVRELLARMDAREFAEWMIYLGIEPFGDDWRPLATLAALTANAHSADQKFATDDFLPLTAPPPKANSTSQDLIAWAKRHGDRNQP